MNAFESGDRKLIPAVLVYVRSSDGRILMIHRGGRPGDIHAGKWNGLGGKLDLGESPWSAASRELEEESGISLTETEFKILGTLQFPNFKPKASEDWLVWVFNAQLATTAEKTRIEESEEGALEWIDTQEIGGLNLWPGDRLFLPHVFEGRAFFGTIWYEKNEVVRHHIEVVG